MTDHTDTTELSHALARLSGGMHSRLGILQDSLARKRSSIEIAESVEQARKYIGEFRDVISRIGAYLSSVDPLEKLEKHDKHRGLYIKYHVSRNDGNSKHKGCCYFVLDWDHDPYTIPAILAYIQACEAEYPLLARDLRREVAKRWLAKDQAPK